MSDVVKIIYRVVDKATVSLAKIAAGITSVGTQVEKHYRQVDLFGKSVAVTGDSSKLASGKIFNLGVALQKSGGLFSGLGPIIQGLGQKIAALGPIAETATAMIVAFLAVKAAQAIVGFVSSSIRAFADFEYAMADVAAKLGVTVGSIVELTDLAKEMGIKYGVGAKVAAEGLVAFAAAGFDAEESAIALEEAMKLSIITGATLEQSSRLLVQSLAVYGDEAKAAAGYVDALVAADLASIASATQLGVALGYVGGQAAAFGMDVQETLTAVAALTNKVGQAEKAGRYLDALFSDLAKKSDRLGFTIYDASGELRPFADILGMVAYKMEGMTTETKMAWLAEIGLTRQSSRALLNLSELGNTAEETRDAFYELEVEISKSGAATDAVQTKMNTLRFAMDQWNATVQNLKVSIGKGLSPVMTLVVQGATALVGGFTWLINVLNAVGTTVGRVVLPPLKALWTAFGWLWEQLSKYLQPALDIFVGTLKTVGNVVNWALSSWEKFWTTVSGGMKKAGEVSEETTEGMKADWASLTDEVNNSVENMVDTVNDLLAKGFVGDAQDEIQKFVDCSVNKALDLHDQIRDSVYDLTVEMHERYARMVKDAEYLGGEQGKAMLRAAEDLKQGYLDKIGTLEEWQKKAIEGWYGPSIGDIVDDWAERNGDIGYEPSPTNYPSVDIPIITRDITVNLGGINIESITSDIDKEELLEEIGETIVDAVLAVGGNR